MAKKNLILFFLFWVLSIQVIVAQKVTEEDGWLKKVMSAEQQGDYARAAAMLCQHYYTHFDSFSYQRLQSLVSHYDLQGYELLLKKWQSVLARFFMLFAVIYCVLFLWAFGLLLKRKKSRYLFLCWGLMGIAAWFFYSLPPLRLVITRSVPVLTYQAPSAAARLVATLPGGSCLTVLGEQPLWWKVRTPQGEVAYVQKSLAYLVEVETAQAP
jgi:hypothetical protein